MTGYTDPVLDPRLVQAMQILKGHGHMCDVWKPVPYPELMTTCEACGAAFKFNDLTGLLEGTVKGNCPEGTAPTVLSRPVEVVTVEGSDLVQKFETTHPLLPEGVSYQVDPDWVVAPDGDDLLPIEATIEVNGLRCDNCSNTDTKRGYMVSWLERNWACVGCGNCRLYLWAELQPKGA